MTNPDFVLRVKDGRPVPTDARPHFVYVIRDAAGIALYVGMTDRPMPRMLLHRKQSIWFTIEADRIEFGQYSDRASAAQGEWQTIRALRPKYNVMGNGGAANAA